MNMMKLIKIIEDKHGLNFKDDDRIFWGNSRYGFLGMIKINSNTLGFLFLRYYYVEYNEKYFTKFKIQIETHDMDDDIKKFINNKFFEFKNYNIDGIRKSVEDNIIQISYFYSNRISHISEIYIGDKILEISEDNNACQDNYEIVDEETRNSLKNISFLIPNNIFVNLKSGIIDSDIFSYEYSFLNNADREYYIKNNKNSKTKILSQKPKIWYAAISNNLSNFKVHYLISTFGFNYVKLKYFDISSIDFSSLKQINKGLYYRIYMNIDLFKEALDSPSFSFAKIEMSSSNSDRIYSITLKFKNGSVRIYNDEVKNIIIDILKEKNIFTEADQLYLTFNNTAKVFKRKQIGGDK